MKLNDPISKADYRRMARELQQINNTIGATAQQMEQDIAAVLKIIDGPTSWFGSKVNDIEQVLEKYREIKVIQGRKNASPDPKPEASGQTSLDVD